MGDYLRKVSSGQTLQIPAQTYNLLMDMARDWLASKQTGSAPAFYQKPPTILVKNESGSDVSRYGILGVSDILISPTDNLGEFKHRQAIRGDLPSTTDHSGGRAVILAEYIADGKIGKAYASGTCQVQINVTSESHTCADITDGDATKLTSADSGPFTILWKETGTGDKWAIVRFGAVGGGSTGILSCEVMHEPDDGNDYYDIKLTTWAPDWESDGVWYEGVDKPTWESFADEYEFGVAATGSNDHKVKYGDKYWGSTEVHQKSAANYPGSAGGPWVEIQTAVATHNDREWQCDVSHLSELSKAPGLTADWSLIETTKAYSFTPIGALSTCVPKYTRGDKVPYFYDAADQKIKLLIAFLQAGENIGTDAEPVWVQRSLGWSSKATTPTLTIWGRVMALFRSP